MKLVAIVFAVLLTAPAALAQAPSSVPRDPLWDEMAAIARTCSLAEPATQATINSVPPERYEEAAVVCEAALVQLDAALASVPAPTDRQRSDHAVQTFFLHRTTGSYYRRADLGLLRQGRAGDPLIPGPRTCRAYEHALDAYGRIDSGRRIVAGRDIFNWFLARDLNNCRDRYGAPDGAAAIPAVARPVAPTPLPGTLHGDFDAVVRPCLSLAMDRDVPFAERTGICERASEAVSTVMAIYPDAPDVDRIGVEISLVQLYTFLAILQSGMDGRATPRACASLEKAVAAEAVMEARGQFRHPVSPMIDALLQTRLAPCGVVRPSQ